MLVGDDVQTTEELLGNVGEEGAGFSTLAQTINLGLRSCATDSNLSRYVVATESDAPPQER